MKHIYNDTQRNDDWIKYANESATAEDRAIHDKLRDEFGKLSKAEWDESKHKRGGDQKNKGRFSVNPGGKKAKEYDPDSGYPPPPEEGYDEDDQGDFSWEGFKEDVPQEAEDTKQTKPIFESIEEREKSKREDADYRAQQRSQPIMVDMSPRVQTPEPVKKPIRIAGKPVFPLDFFERVPDAKSYRCWILPDDTIYKVPDHGKAAGAFLKENGIESAKGYTAYNEGKKILNQVTGAIRISGWMQGMPLEIQGTEINTDLLNRMRDMIKKGFIDSREEMELTDFSSSVNKLTITENDLENGKEVRLLSEDGWGGKKYEVVH